MTRPWITWCGLTAVALAAALLSFASLRSLAVACGTPGGLAWLLPVCIDAAAVVATRVWLAGAHEKAARFARTLALGMVALSVAGNGLDHFLTAYGLRPAWWAVVCVAAVPPAVLGAVAHLAALAGRARRAGGRPAGCVSACRRPGEPRQARDRAGRGRRRTGRPGPSRAGARRAGKPGAPAAPPAQRQRSVDWRHLFAEAMPPADGPGVSAKRCTSAKGDRREHAA